MKRTSEDEAQSRVREEEDRIKRGKRQDDLDVSDVDPRSEAEAQIARALQIVCDANCTLGCLIEDPGNGHRPDCGSRDYTPDELETLFFTLGMAMVQLAKVPGGKEARDRFYTNAKDQLMVRGRQDLLTDLKDEQDRKSKAKNIVKKALGDDIDFSIGTSGHAMMRMVELEMEKLDQLRVKITALADSMTIK